MDKELQLLNDKFAIRQVQYNYARAIDTRNRDLLRSIYADEITYDWTDFDPNMIETVPADKWVDNTFALIKGLKATEHQMTNFLIEVDGDHAKATTYLRAMHYLPNTDGDNWCECGGIYWNEYVRTEAGWKIERIKLNILWWTGNQDLFRLAML